MVAGDLLLEQAGGRRRPDADGRLRQVAGAVGAGDHEGHRAVGLLAAVEEVDARLDDPPRRLVVLEGDRPLVAPRRRVGRRVLAQLHDGPSDVGAGDAELVHVAHGIEGHPRRRREDAERHAPLHRGGARVARRRRGRRLGPAEAGGPRTGPDGAVGDHDVGHAARDGGGRVQQHAHRAAPAVGDPGREADLLDPHRPHELGLLDGIHRVAHEPVDVPGGQPGVGEGGGDGLAGELQLRAPGLPGELGAAHADDGGAAPERDARARHHATSAGSTGSAGRNTGTAAPSAVGRKWAVTRMPMRMASGATSVRFDITRTPSSRSTSAATTG